MSYARSLVAPSGTFAALSTAAIFTMKTSPNGGLWSINDRTAVYDATANRVYVGYTSSAGAVTILAWNPTTKAVTSTVTLETGLELHAAPAILVRDDGYILVGWSAHDGTTLKLARSTSTHDASAFNTATTITAATLDTWPDITYIYLHQLASGRIFMFWREVHASANYGRLAYSYSDDEGVTWSLRSLVVIGQTSSQVVYWKSISDSTKIHLFHTDTDRSDATPSSLYHRYYDAADGLWHKSDGTTVSSTDPTTSTLIHNAASGPISPQSCGLESDGTPFASYTIYKSGTTSDDLYVARYRSAAWQNNLVVNNGGLANTHRTLAGIAVNAGNPNRAFCSVKSGSNHEWFLYTSGDDGVTWTGAQLTFASGSNALGPQNVLDAPSGLEFVGARGTWTTDSSYSVGMEGYGF